jgi:catechol 2,3-dioxygenase-like lactoylglutathione lyase family enzyme
LTPLSNPQIDFRGLLMVTATVPDAEAAARIWCGATEQIIFARGAIEPQLASLWDVAAATHERGVVVGAVGADRGYLRLVSTDIADYRHALQEGKAPAGPLGFEFLSRDVDEAVVCLRNAGFEVIGGPLDFDNGPAGGGFARAARIVAPGGYTLLINTIKRVPAPRTLPRTELLLGGGWNAIITAADRPAVECFYGRTLGMTALFDGVLDQDSIRETNRFPPGWAFEMLVYGAGAPMQMIENEIHPAGHLYAPARAPGRLPRGNAIVTLLVGSLDPLIVRAEDAGIAVRGPVRPDAFPYAGRRVAALDGPNGEMIEFVETGC